MNVEIVFRLSNQFRTFERQLFEHVCRHHEHPTAETELDTAFLVVFPQRPAAERSCIVATPLELPGFALGWQRLDLLEIRNNPLNR